MHPRLRRLFAGAGVACLTLSALCFASEGALRAAPLLAVRLHLPFPSHRIAVDGPAGPTPSPGPRRAWLGRGPIVVKGTGTYQLGLNRSSRNGLSTGYDNYSTALTLGIERRTEQSALSITNGFGYGTGGLSTGSILIGYRTPAYGLSYGQVTGPSDSQLQVGGFARGIGLSLPLRNGDVSYLVSTATQQIEASSVTYRVYGVRRNWNALGGFFSAAGYYGASEQGTGRQTIADLSYRRYGAKLSTQTEVALSRSSGASGSPTGTQLASAFQADIQGKSLFTTIGLRYDPTGFQTLTSSIDGGFSADLALRKHTDALGDISLDLGHTDDHTIGSALHGNRLTLAGGRSWKLLNIQYVAGLQGSSGNGNSSLQRTGALTFSETLHGLSLFETYQAAGTTGSTGIASQRQIALGASRALLGGTGAYQFTRSASNGGDSTGSGASHALSFRHSVGRKLDLQLTQAFQTTTNNGVSTQLTDTAVNLVRRLSSVVALQAGIDVFRQTGIGGGHGTVFSASLVGPFGFGQPTTGGRANPNLPAVIRGTVTYSTSPTPFAYSAPVQRGFNNALVVLDGKITQRTDSAGEFEFRFVSQGAHTIRIDSATISPGLIADREYVTLSVLGGQTANVNFAVGNFAGVQGTVIAQDQNGAKKPLANVGISVDGLQAVTTTSEGRFQIGRLNPGAHTVELVEATIPSTVAFIGDRKKTVTVTAGTATTVNFIATPLGSIGGTVVAPSDGGFGALAGLHNIYVVAQPGEHAAITDDDGAFLLDNMPPGTYTLTVDSDTVPEGLSVLSGPEGPVNVVGGGTVSGVIFKLGAGAKDVLYTFNDGKRQTIRVETEPAIVPPGALLRIRATTTAKDVKALFVESDVFPALQLRPEPHTGVWIGTTIVPALAKGDYALSVTARRKEISDGSALVPVDPTLPLFAIRLSPRSPVAGQTMRVTIKSLAGVEEGDAILFEDGYRIGLPKATGRVFAFDMRLWRKGLPYSGVIITKRGQNFPIVLR